MVYFEFKQPYEGKTKVRTRCRMPNFCVGYEIDVGMYDLNSKRMLPRSVKQKGTFTKISTVLFGKKLEKIGYLMG